MRKEIKVHVEQITDGFLFTEHLEDNKKVKSFNDSKNFIFSLLNKSPEVQGVMNNENDVMVEIALYDIEPEEIDNLRDQIVVKEKFNPFKNNSINEEELRLSVNKENAYSSERLKNIDFLDLDSKLPMTHVRKAEIAGTNKTSFYPHWSKIEKGTPTFGSPTSRITFTILAKYYELALNIRTSKQDEIQKLREGIELEVSNLDKLYKQNNHIHSSKLETIILSLKQLIK